MTDFKVTARETSLLNPFTEMVSQSPSTALHRRADALASSAKLAYEVIVNRLKTERVQMQDELRSMMDFAPTSKDSLCPNVQGRWDATSWANRLHDLTMTLKYNELSLNEAINNYNELFVPQTK